MSIGSWVYNFDGIFSATAVLIVATIFQVVISSILHKRVEKREIGILLAVIIFGGITLWFRDPTFIQWKPTILNWVLAVIFLFYSVFFEKNLLERMLGSKLELPAQAWKKLNLIWIGNFLIVGTLNIYVAINFSESIWVSYKLYSAIFFTILLAILTIIIVIPYSSKSEETERISKDQD